MWFQFPSQDLANISTNEFRFWEISLKGCRRLLILINSENNLHASLPEACTCPPAAAEEINYLN